MNWTKNPTGRRERLPADWAQRRKAVKLRAGDRCEARFSDTGERCPGDGTDVDHIIAGDDHALTNLQMLCEWHHKRKTAGEAQAARAASPPRTSKHPGEKHPSGLRFY